jgi:hypothetical protein
MALSVDVQKAIASGNDFDLVVGGSATLTIKLKVAGASRRFALRVGTQLLPKADQQVVDGSLPVSCQVVDWGGARVGSKVRVTVADGASAPASDDGAVVG